MGGYPFSLPMIFLLVFAILIVLGVVSGVFALRKHILLGFLFWGYIFLVTFGNLQLDSGVISLSLLFCLMLPLFVIVPILDLRSYCQKWFLRGQYLNWGICLIGLLLQIVGAPSLGSLIPLMVPQRTTPLLAGLLRINGLMIEPSFLAIYLVFGYIVNEYVPQRQGQRDIARVVFVGLLLLTGSLSGLSLWLLYLGLMFLERFGKILWFCRIQKTTAFRGVRVGLVTVGLMLLLALVGGQNLGSVFWEYLVYRWDRVVLFLRTANFYSSEGVRLSAIPIAFQYLKEGHLFGEGYSNVEQWLVAYTWLADGKIHNIYTYLLIAFGLPGVVLFLALLFVVVRSAGRRNFWALIVWVVAGFATGHLIIYYLWGYLFLFTLADQQPRGYLDNSTSATPLLGEVKV